MNVRPPLWSRNLAFTLVELLTVIAIIAILMGLLFPVATMVINHANRVRAKTDLVATVSAVKQFNSDYGKYPLSGQTFNTDVTFGDATSGATSPVGNEALYNILRNYPGMNRPNPDGNPKQVVFFEGKFGIGSAGNPRGGFATSSTGGTGTLGAFYDPWGNQYAVAIDGDYDNFVKAPYQDFMQGSANGLNYGCVAWSAGKDGKLGNKGDNIYKNASGTVSDDVISWQ